MDTQLLVDSSRLSPHENVMMIHRYFVDSMPGVLPGFDSKEHVLAGRTMFAIMDYFPLTLQTVLSSQANNLSPSSSSSSGSSPFLAECAIIHIASSCA
jgi:hypothetical protein